MKKFIILLLGLISLSYGWAQGPGYCLEFDSSYVSLSNSDDILSGTPFTLEAWIKTNHKHGSGTTQGRILTLWRTADTTYETAITIFVSDDRIGFAFWNGAWQNILTTISSPYYHDNKWHHIAATHNGTTYRVYFDGEQIASSNTSLSTSYFNKDKATIGGRPTNDRYFFGQIDEVRIWSTVRTPDEIKQNMHRELRGNESGLEAYYKMSDGSSTSLTDNSGNSHTGTISGASWVNSTAPVPFRTVSGAANWNSTSSWLSSTIPNSRYAHTYIPFDIYANGNYDVGDLEVASSQMLNINNDASLRVNGSLNNNGTIKVLSSSSSIGSFIELGSRTSTGTMIVERYYTKAGWHYTSIPISSVVSGIFQGSALYKYNETDADPNKRWVAIGSYENLTPGKGYDVYYPTTSDKTVSFNGTYNTGNQSISLTYTSSNSDPGWNLIGNPYPSTINWDAGTGWTKTNVNNAIYIWDETHTNDATLDGKIRAWVNGSAVNGGSPYIAATQGFFVKCNTTSPSLSMTNEVRYFGSGTPRSSTSNSELRITVIGKTNTDESVIYFTPNATSLFDGNYDALKFYSYNRLDPQIFTLDENNTEYSINGIPYFYQNLTVPLNLYVGIDDDYSLEFDFSKLEERVSIFLEDKQENKMIDLFSEPVYHFSALMEGNRNRFLIHFLPIQSLSPYCKDETSGVDEDVAEDMQIYAYGKNIYIASDLQRRADISLYDMLGKQLLHESTKLNGLYVKALDFNSGAYIIRLETEDGVFTKKIVLQ